jgi:hypothetical protein
MYYNGQGVSRDFNEAVKWFKLAADQGSALGQKNLGVMYDMGHGVPQDFKQAVKWYTLSATQGYVYAQYNLGFMYANGQGVAQDFNEALYWYRLAAAQNNALAINNLGSMFEDGQGVSPSKVVAYALYHVSATQAPGADNKAADNRKGVAAKMTPALMDAAQQLIRDVNKSGNTLAAIDAYLSKPVVTEVTPVVAK